MAGISIVQVFWGAIADTVKELLPIHARLVLAGTKKTLQECSRF